MESYKERITTHIDLLNSIEFPCSDWKKDKVYFDKLEAEFVKEPTDAETKLLWKSLLTLIYEKRMDSLNRNKTTEELFAGWNDD